ncbi:hypothetical protein [Ensifer adhaerens]|uniref:hypothetical protein n=1 Tax=Ensifer adhaerens TaxID=106592 RepID=UPI000990103B|nr:hypothetical protein [Ensifer adhaerens]
MSPAANSHCPRAQDQNSSASGGFRFGGALGSSPSVSGVQVGGGKGSGSTNWISEQSGLVSDGKMDVTVGGNTHLGAGKIISESGDLKLSTDTLTHENFDGAKQYEGFNANLGIDLTGGKGTSANPIGNSTLEGNYKLDDTRQEVNATVGPGQIEVRNEEKQAALEQDGTSTLPLDEINRDPDQAYQITKDKHVDVEVYLSTNSLKAAVEAGQTVSQAIGDALNHMASDGKLTPDDHRAAAELSAYRNDPKVLAQLGECGQQRGETRFDVFDWLITPAHASPASCVISAGGRTFTISPQGAMTCIQLFTTETGLAVSQASAATAAMTAGIAGLFLLASATPAGGKVDETAKLKDGTTLHMTGQQSERNRNVLVTLPDGQKVTLILSTTEDGGLELLSGTVLGGPMSEPMLGAIAKQLTTSGAQVVYNDKAGAEEPKRNKKASTSQVGDKVRTPETHPEDFTKIEKTKYKNTKTGEIWEESHTTHTDKNGEWKVGSRPGKVPKKTDKITVGSDGTILKF